MTLNEKTNIQEKPTLNTSSLQHGSIVIEIVVHNHINTRLYPHMCYTMPRGPDSVFSISLETLVPWLC